MENTHFTATTTEQTSKLKQIFRPVQEVISEGLLEVTEEGLEFNAADPAMIGLSHFKIKENFFDTFEVEEEVQQGINVENFFDMLKKATNDNKVTLKYGEGEEKEMWMLENQLEKGFEVKKSFKKLNLSEDDVPSVGDLDFKNKYEADTEKLKTLINYFDKFCDSMVWKSTENGLEFSSEMKDTHMDAQLDTENEHIRYEEFEEEVQSMFSINYLKTQLAGNTLPSLTDKIDISMGEQFPLRISYEDENFVYIFVLAPRIEEE